MTPALWLIVAIFGVDIVAKVALWAAYRRRLYWEARADAELARLRDPVEGDGR